MSEGSPDDFTATQLVQSRADRSSTAVQLDGFQARYFAPETRRRVVVRQVDGG